MTMMVFLESVLKVIAYLLLLVGVGGGLVWLIKLIIEEGEKSRKAFEQQLEEQERKRRAFLRWYESLPDEQKYLVDQQMAQVNSMRAMQALMGFHLMHDMMHHDNHTDSHFPFL